MIFHHERRLHRALHHLESFKAERTAWRKTGPHTFWTEPEDERGKKVIWARVLKPPPASLSLIAGDCIHNLRAALDNLAFELALAYSRGRVSKGIESDSGFPIFATCSQQDMKKLNKVIRGIDPLAKTIIKGLQPYNREDGFSSDRLWQLNQLEVIDKHRLPHVITLNNVSALSFFELEGIGLDEIEVLWRFFDESAPIAEYPARDSNGAEVYVHFTAAFDVCFSERVPDPLMGVSIPDTLEGIHRHIVNEVLPPLREFLTPQ